MHQLMRDNGFYFVFFEEFEGPRRNEDSPVLSADGGSQFFIRLHDSKMDSRNSFELAEEIYVDLPPLFARVDVRRGDLPNPRRIPVPPYKEGDDPRRCQAADDRAEHGDRNSVPGIRDHPRLRYAEDEASCNEGPEEDRDCVQPCKQTHPKLRIPGIRDEDIQEGPDRGPTHREDRQGEGREPIVLESFDNHLSEASHPASPLTAVSRPAFSATPTVARAKNPDWPRDTRPPRLQRCRRPGRSWRTSRCGRRALPRLDSTPSFPSSFGRRSDPCRPTDKESSSRSYTRHRGLCEPPRRLPRTSPARGCGPPAEPPAQARQAPYDYYIDSNLVKTCPRKVRADAISGERRGLGRQVREPLRQNVQGRQQDRLRAQRAVRLELHDDPRRVVCRLHGLDLVLLHELLARLAVRREYEGLFLLRRRGLHVALAERDVRIEGVQRLAPGLQDRIVPVSHAVRRLPLRVLFPRAEDRGRVDEHRLAVPELDDRDLRILRPQLRVADRLQVRGRHDPGAALVHRIDDRAVRATLAVARRAILSAVVEREVRRDRDEAEAGGGHLVEKRGRAFLIPPPVRPDR